MKSGIVASLIIVILGLGAGCSTALGNTPVKISDQNNSQIPGVVIPNWDMVENFVKADSTFQFDGVKGSIKLVNATADAADVNWQYTVEYQTNHAGHGDRTGHMMAQVITNHEVIVSMTNGQIVSAVCDDSWNLLNDSPVDSSENGLQGSLGQEITVPFGQTVNFSGEELAVTFAQVLSDSRSPTGAETIWPGEAVCRIQVTYQGATSEVTLTESGANKGFTQLQVLQYKLNFQLTPYPEAGKRPKMSDYALILIVTK